MKKDPAPGSWRFSCCFNLTLHCNNRSCVNMAVKLLSVWVRSLVSYLKRRAQFEVFQNELSRKTSEHQNAEGGGGS
jgi:hypothetical protein